MSTPVVLSAGTMSGDDVKNPQGEKLGDIEDLMIDIDEGRIAYAVLSFGGILGMGDKLFAIPWSALKLNASDHSFTLDVPKERLEKASGFNKDSWPNFADRRWGEDLHKYYGYSPYWS